MDGQTIPLETVVRFALRLGVIFALIFLIAVLTPWMAKKIDAWIARYRKGHDPKRDPNYTVRSRDAHGFPEVYISGYGSEAVNKLVLWSAKPIR